MKTLNDEKGAVLVTVLILLMIITLIGVIAVNISTVDIQIAGNQKRVSTVFEGAEAGVDVAIGVIENTISNGTLTPGAPIGIITALDSANLENEIMAVDAYNTDSVTGTADLTMSSLNGVAVTVDIDYMYTYIMPGWSAEMGVGHEGVGVTGGKAALFSLNSNGT